MKNNIFKFITKFISLICIFTFLVFIGLGTFFLITINNLNDPVIESIVSPKYSKIYDSSNNVIETLGNDEDYYIKYEDLPPLLIDALLSIEDAEFYYHKGINPKRVIISLINNINPHNSIQGGSTITQQLIKNLFLTNEKSYQRKIKEAYLSLKLEKELTKEEILEHYFNRVYFEKSVPGICYAAKKFFDKNVQELNLVEICALVSLVKSPSQYDPYKHIDNLEKRKNIVLKAMLTHQVISQNEYNLASSIEVNSLLNKNSNNFEATKYQAYLDVVYKEASKILNYDIFSYPVKIETYLDTSLQSYLDRIQEGDIITFNNDNMQIGAAVIKEKGHISGIIGGRNYHGKKLFNHSYDMKTNPASIIKPIYSYALGVEYLHYNEMTTLIDEPYYYPGTSLNINNVDHQYLGKLSLIEALGYSRNTCAIKVLEQVVKKIGKEKVISYLEDLNIMDEGPFSYSYAIGGMTYGTNPINIAGAYSMLRNHGKYYTPTTIKRIIDIETNKILYENTDEEKRVISNESADIITSSLERMIDGNYYNIGIAKPNNIIIAGKTGTGGYDINTIKKYNFPNNADKDIWFSGYSSSNTVSIWTGFDKPIKNKHTYFANKDETKKIAKRLFNLIISYVSNKNEHFNISENLTKVFVVKHQEKAYLPNEYTPSKYISFAYYKKEDIPNEVLPYPILNPINNVNVYQMENSIYISILDTIKEDNIYSNFYGNKGYLITISNEDYFQELFIESNEVECNLPHPGIYEIKIVETFKENYSLKGDSYDLIFTYF
ncbi:MAG: transglycosylase domain-containing protein [Bacillales bacterium]|nr:transglycosylase domain-containing protein [Bacillales bacterium]